MLDTPSLVTVAENIKRCSLFYASRSLGDAAENGASAIYVVFNARRRVDYFRGEEHCVDRLGVGSLCVPAI
jgi:hypothetical protein